MEAIRTTRRSDRGEVSWVGLAMLLGLAGAAYLAWVWVPAYARRYEVGHIVRSAANGAVRNRDDASLLREMTSQLRALESVSVETASGEVQRVPLLDLSPADVVWERDEQAKTLRIAFSYTVDVVYPWVDRVQPFTTDVDVVADLSAPDWEDKKWGGK